MEVLDISNNKLDMISFSIFKKKTGSKLKVLKLQNNHWRLVIEQATIRGLFPDTEVILNKQDLRKLERARKPRVKKRRCKSRPKTQRAMSRPSRYSHV